MNKGLGQLISLLDAVYYPPFELKLRARVYSQLGPELRLLLVSELDEKLWTQLRLQFDNHIHREVKNEI